MSEDAWDTKICLGIVILDFNKWDNSNIKVIFLPLTPIKMLARFPMVFHKALMLKLLLPFKKREGKKAKANNGEVPWN